MDGIVQCLSIRRDELNAFRGHDPFGFGKRNLRTKSHDLIVSVGCSFLRFLLRLEVITFPSTLRTTLDFPPIFAVRRREFEDFVSPELTGLEPVNPPLSKISTPVLRPINRLPL